MIFSRDCPESSREPLLFDGENAFFDPARKKCPDAVGVCRADRLFDQRRGQGQPQERSHHVYFGPGRDISGSMYSIENANQVGREMPVDCDVGAGKKLFQLLESQRAGGVAMRFEEIQQQPAPIALLLFLKAVQQFFAVNSSKKVRIFRSRICLS